MTEPLWVKFRSANRPGRTTSSWVVETQGQELELGYIDFYPRWRCYVFAPLHDTVYEKSCLRVIADFCEQKTKEWRASFGRGVKKA